MTTVEDRLRDALTAKAEQLTDERLDQLAGRRERSLDDLLDGGHTGELPVLAFQAAPAAPRHRWIAPGLAAAAVVALAVGATSVVANRLTSQPRPNSPVSQVIHPSPSSSPPASPSPSAPASPTTVAVPDYLSRGQQGSRSQVPWSSVGAGWRLLLPASAAASPAALYLYDPAGGRYLINDRLPASAALLAWSPDGTRAMLRSGTSDAFRYQEVTLRTGDLSTGFTVSQSNFASYTRPKGLAVLLTQRTGYTSQLLRYSTAGHLEHRYAKDLAGLGEFKVDNALYLPDGSAFVTQFLAGPPVLVTNGGQLVRAYPVPTGYDYCRPLKWWAADTVLEVCMTPSGPGERAAALYLQPAAGGTPSVLTDAAGPADGGYGNAWPLSNGHVLLAVHVSCGDGTYYILVPGKAPRQLQAPARVGQPGSIISMAGDLATFAVRDNPGCGGVRDASALVDYDLVTGQTHQLLDRLATIVNWPADPS